MGGEYSVWFKDNEKAEQRKILYLLENLGIIIMESKKGKKGFYKYGWSLTKKGEKIVMDNKLLYNLWEKRKINEFYHQIKELL